MNTPLYNTDGALVAYTLSDDSGSTIDIIGSLAAGDDLYYDSDGINYFGTVESVELLSVATFFEARTELQALAEDGNAALAGWKPIHQGWLVTFENGVSLYGSLPSLNQNIQGLGVQGPTSTAGNNGRPLLLNQGVTISGASAQVNGWKSSQSPTSYALNPSDVWEDDDVFTYADAYISWDGTTGQVSAPGAYSGTLIEYPATNTVEVDVD